MYIQFSKQEKDLCDKTNLLDYLKHKGEQVEFDGNIYYWINDKGAKINLNQDGNKFYDTANKKGGFPIQFIKQYFNMNFSDAMVELLRFHKTNDLNLAIKSAQKKGMLFPEIDKSRNVLNQLFRSMGIDSSVSGFFIESGKLYEDSKYHNAVFVGHDEQGEIASGYKMSIYEQSLSQYQSYIENSDSGYTFNHFGGSDKLLVFNNPLEMLAYISVNKEIDWQKDNYIANFNDNSLCLKKALERNPHIKNVTFACYHELSEHDSGLSNGIRKPEYKPHDIYKAIFPNHHFNVIQPETLSFRNDLKVLLEMTPAPELEPPENVLAMQSG